MNDRPSQTYYCQNLGCPNGYGSTFEAAPESWFQERGMSLPKNCPDCKAWIDAQQDQAFRCGSCGNTMRVTARRKISHHKKTGYYQLPEQCGQCERGVRPRVGVSGRSENRSEERRQRKVLQLPRTRPVRSYPLLTSIEFYARILGGGETRREHIERHTTWSPHSLVGNGKSATALSGQVESFEGLLRSANVVSQSQNSDRIVEYRGDNGYIVKVTLTDSQRIEVTIINHMANPATGQHELITTYDGYTVSKVNQNLQSGKWQ